VPENIKAVRGIDGDTFDVRAFGERLVQVFEFAVNAGYNDVAALKEEFRAGGPGSHLGLFAVNDEGDLLGI
jgi:hypothetical protein